MKNYRFFIKIRNFGKNGSFENTIFFLKTGEKGDSFQNGSTKRIHVYVFSNILMYDINYHTC